SRSLFIRCTLPGRPSHRRPSSSDALRRACVAPNLFVHSLETPPRRSRLGKSYKASARLSARTHERVPMSDQQITCAECGNVFAFSAAEQQFYTERGLASPPKRCKACRQARRASQGGPGDRGPSRDRGPRHSGNPNEYRSPMPNGNTSPRGGGGGGFAPRGDRGGGYGNGPPRGDRGAPRGGPGRGAGGGFNGGFSGNRGGFASGGGGGGGFNRGPSPGGTNGG